VVPAGGGMHAPGNKWLRHNRALSLTQEFWQLGDIDAIRLASSRESNLAADTSPASCKKAPPEETGGAGFWGLKVG
jgi:hypothetical protein